MFLEHYLKFGNSRIRIDHISSSSGFTILELMVVIVILMVVTSIATPSFSAMKGDLQASDDARAIAATMGELRAQAIRTKTNVTLTFHADGFSWDLDGDSVEDGSLIFHQASSWATSTPDFLTFNGLGLVRGIASEIVLIVENRGHSFEITVNTNGHISV